MFAFKTHSSWCEKIIFISISVICIILALDYKFTILPINGIFLIGYLFIITVCTTWITFTYLQSLLQANKPFEYDLEKHGVLKLAVTVYNYLSVFAKSNPRELKRPDVTPTISPTSQQFQNLDVVEDIDSKVFQEPSYTERRTKNIDERIDDLIRDIEVRFILKWYLNISADPSFPSEAKAILDEIIRRFLQIVVEVDGRKLVYGCVVIFLKHVKEFRKTVKRSQKSDGVIEELYRYSHIGSKSQKAMEHFIFRLTANMLRQFINWELWNSLPCRSLVAILSRRFTTYIITYVSSPGFLNYKIVQACASEPTKMRLKLDNYYFISVGDVDHSGSLKQLNKSDPVPPDVRDKNIEVLKFEESGTPKISPKKVTKRTTPDTVDCAEEFDVVDACRKPKDDPKPRNGTETKIAETTTSESQTPVKVSEMKFTEPDKTVAVTQKVESRPKASEPVKIYESKSTTRTWRNSSDLECISLGQDLLAFQEFTDPDTQIQELIEKKLWKDNTDTTDDEKTSSMWDIPESWYGEEEVSDAATEGVAVSPTTNFQNYLTTAANTAFKPIGDVTASTLHNMKELQQSTVNTVNTVVKPVSQATTNAMHKIGDLQNTNATPMQCLDKTQDEAAGMVEGILDFGMAGLRKGLRLTGLQENFSELTQKAKNEFHRPDGHKPIDIQKPAHGKVVDVGKVVDKDSRRYVEAAQKNAAKLVKTPHVASEDKLEQVYSSSESDESVWINPLNKDSPSSFDGHILLEKTPDSAPQPSISDIHKLKKLYDSPDSGQKLPLQAIPQITEDILLAEDSPDPEYEEAQDFASTIAKLRTLLQQKSSESGVTTPSLSPMPQDDTAKTPSEPPNVDLTKIDGAMPSLYKFCARTATGVFQNTLNTIKTALPGNVNEAAQGPIRYHIEDWTFVEADASNNDFNSRMKKLLSERRAYCTVDTAYEAIDSLEIIDQPDAAWTVPISTQFDDELDESDPQVPITRALVDIICELIGDTNTYLLQESVVKALLLLIGNYTEEFITRQSDTLLHNVNKFVGKLPENIRDDVIAMKLQDMVKICLERFPGHATTLLGESTAEAGMQLFISSIQSQRINQDIFMQMFELFASELINACSQVSPAYSA